MSSVHTCPPTKPHRIMTSTARALTEPASGRFMRRRHDIDDFDDQPDTQEEQDVEDEEARKQAMRNLVNSWQERLQLISVITTFFASMEAAILVNTKPGSRLEWENNVLLVSNASLLGALIVHVYASVLSFLGAFLLISYKLREARREEMIVEGIPLANSPLRGPVIKDVERDPIDPPPQRVPKSNDAQSAMRKSVNFGAATSAPEQDEKNGSHRPHVRSADPHVEQVGPFKSHASSHRLLCRTHGLCVFLAGVGFALNIVGLLCYSWALQPNAVSIFASVCMGGALLSILVLCF